MAEYNSDGTTTYEPGESNDRAVPGDAPVDPPVDPPVDEVRGGVHMPARPGHLPVQPGQPAHPIAPGGGNAPARPTHPIAPGPAPKR